MLQTKFGKNKKLKKMYKSVCWSVTQMQVEAMYFPLTLFCELNFVLLEILKSNVSKPQKLLKFQK